MKKFIWKGACMLLPILCACTSELEDTTTTETGSINKIVVSLPDWPLGSRTLINVTDKVTYAWAQNDTIGIFPDTGFQVAFDMSSAEGDTYATFTGGGWALKGSSQYAAYYPFEYNNRESDRIPIVYTGQKQTGNKNTDLLGRYNYMAAKASTPANGSVDFDMQRLGRLIILKFAVPEPTTLTSVKLVAPDNVFTTQGYISLWDETLSVTSVSKSNALTIDLEDVTTTTADEEVTVYFFMLPIDLSEKTLSVETTDVNGGKKLYSVAGKNMTESKAYALSATSLREINVETAGTLSTYITDEEKYTITSLKITGPLNGTDIKFIREMAGSDYSAKVTDGQLTTLDISEASIVAGGESYIYSQSAGNPRTPCSTEDNVLGNNFFLNCSLVSIKLPESITSIGDYAFYGCDKLQSIEIPRSVNNVSQGAFYACKNLREAIHHNDNMTMGSGVFCGCTNLEGFILPKNLTTISASLFSGCYYLTDIEIPKSVESIGVGAFNGAYNIQEIVIPDKVTTIEDHTFYGCRSLKKITLPEGITAIGINAFYGCSSLSEISIPNKVETIGTGAFNEAGLNSIIIPDKVTEIDKNTFTSCKSLKEITLGKSVTSIGEGAFSYVPVEKLYCLGETPPEVKNYSDNYNPNFNSVDKSTAILYVPNGLQATYQAKAIGKYYFTTVVEMD